MAQQVKSEIEALLTKITQLEAQVGNFDGDHALLHRRINEYVESLGRLYASKDGLVGGPRKDDPVEVAAELLAAVDDGGSPDIWMQDLFRSAIMQNQGSKGKAVAVRALRDQLAQRAPALVAGGGGGGGTAAAAGPAAPQQR